MINKKANAAIGVFLFMIVSFALIMCLGIFLYVANTTSTAMHEQLDSMSTPELNYTQILENTIDKIPVAYQVLKWGSFVLIIGMIISIFIGSYLVNTKPIYFIPYIIMSFIATILSVIMANIYDDILITDSDLALTLQQFVASNFILLNLPAIVGAVSIIGGIIMFASYKLGASQNVYAE